jgi:hypothetical protein
MQATHATVGSVANSAAAGSGQQSRGAIVCCWDAYEDRFPVEVDSRDSLLLQGPYDLLRSNAELLSRLISETKGTGGQCGSNAAAASSSRRRSTISASLTSHLAFFAVHADKPCFFLGDLILQLLHTILQLDQLLFSSGHAAPLTLLLVDFRLMPPVATSYPSPPSASSLICTPLTIAGRQSLLHVGFCDRWSDTSAAGTVRALWIPGLDSTLASIPSSERHSASQQLLNTFPQAHIYPPLSWDRLCERKDTVFKRFAASMLPTRWFSLSTMDKVSLVADAMLEKCADGEWMLKGSHSDSGEAVTRITVKGGACAALEAALIDLYSKRQQRCIGIQPFEPGLRQFETRVFLVRDSSCGSGWRPSTTVRTSPVNGDGVFAAELMLPTHGVTIDVARFVDKLLDDHADIFQEAAELDMPLLRIDCGYSLTQKECFLNEFCGCGKLIVFSQVHDQALAYVVGCEFARQLMAYF